MANVQPTISSWSTTEAANEPGSSDSNLIAGDLRAIQAGVRYIYSQDTIASASTCDIGSKSAGSLTISGTTGISSFGTVSAGIRKVVTFSGALTLTYNATSLILPGNANITTTAGDTAEFESLGAGNWRCNWYQADGVAIVGNRITGDFSNATLANRVMFQTSTAASTTSIGVLPSSGGSASALSLYNTTDFSGTSTGNVLQFAQLASESRFTSGVLSGSGTYAPMTFYTGGSERMRIDSSGNVTISSAATAGDLFLGTDTNVAVRRLSGNVLTLRASGGNLVSLDSTNGLTYNYSTGGLGYGTGAGGTVTQGAGSGKGTAVTLNKPCGQITMNNATLNAGTSVQFTLGNSLVAATDTLIVHPSSGGTAGAYLVQCYSVGSGTCAITVRNVSASNLSEALVLNFAIIKGATS